MHYTGKYIDKFEAAMQILFMQKGYDKVQHLDAMGKRCFGFCNGKAGIDYYMPIVNIELAIQDIAKYMNLEDRLTIKRMRSEETISVCDEEGIVYGPIIKEIAIRRPYNIYYNGGNRYLFIKKEGDFYAVTDPDGFPAIYYTKKELEKFFLDEQGMTIRLCESDGGHGKVDDIRKIWNEGWEFYRKTAKYMSRSTERREAFKGYENISSARIALWYGVMNYIQQVEKIWRLHNEIAVISGNEGKLRILESNMINAAENGQVELLPEIESAIWKEMEDEI